MPGRVAELRAQYDAQLRAVRGATLPPWIFAEYDGPLMRTVGRPDRGFVEYRDLGGLDGAELDELIGRQVRFFSERGERFEWKLHGHDLPADLPERLRAAGFVPEDRETVLIGVADEIAGEPRLPEGVSLREVTRREDLDRIDALELAVWEEEVGPAAILEAELATNPDGMVVVVAEAGDLVACAAWVRFEAGTEFATFWGGATLPSWRRRGIYRATVAYRASLAAARGYRLLEVDASDDSRPILERLGFVAVTTTTPYVWSPG